MSRNTGVRQLNTDIEIDVLEKLRKECRSRRLPITFVVNRALRHYLGMRDPKTEILKEAA